MVILLAAALVRGKRGQSVGTSICAGHGRGRGRHAGKGAAHGLHVGLAVVVVFAAHFGILGNLSPAGLSTDHGGTHGKCYNGATEDDDGGGEDEVGAKGHVRQKEDNVDDESDNGDEKRENSKNKETEKVSGGVSSAVCVRSSSHDQHDESDASCDGVQDENVGERLANRVGQAECT